MKEFFSIVFIFWACGITAQKFNHRSKHEKHWALSHPFAALKTRKIYKKCIPYYEEVKKSNTLDAFENGGKLDAFRHTFFMAAFAQKIKAKKLRKLGIAHEKGNYNSFLKGIMEDGELADSLSSVMDLQNNELGFKIGDANKKKSLKDLKDLVTGEIKKGEALYFKRNNSGQYLNCTNEEIDLENYKNKWFIPKCLIPTTH